MQGKGLITTVAIVLSLICANELLPTWYASKVESEAKAIAGNDQEKYQKELDKRSKEPLDLFFTQLSYPEAKKKEMKLGLDLKGGINVLLEIKQRDLVNNLTNYSPNPILLEALDRTDEAQKNSTKSYIEDFFTQFDIVNKEKGANLKLANPEIFGTQNLSSEIKFNTTDEEVKNIITKKIDESVASAYEVIRTRIDKMGVTQPNVQRVPGTGRILVEMPGIKDIDRVKKLLQTSAKLQFWEVHQINEMASYLDQVATAVAVRGDSMGVNKNQDFIQLLNIDKTPHGSAIANIKLSDTASVNKILNSKIAKDLRPGNLKFVEFMWAYKPNTSTPNHLELYAIKSNLTKKAPIDGAVESAKVDYDQHRRIVVDMQMDSNGTKDWKSLTEKNVGRPIAVTLDNRVYTAPNVNEPIPNGRSQISGTFTEEEATDLVNVLGTGKLPASAKIVQADVVGPSLGEESIQAGLWSFFAAFCVIIAYIVFYYGGAGVYAVIAMIFNLFFLFGIMDSMDATLTLPGIAGIVLTMAMAVDTNVIIYERTKEQLFAGKDIKQAYTDGFNDALSAIIDGQLTSILTAIVLYIFGTGPIQGFAVTLLIGLVMTFFTSVLMSRVLIFSRLEKGKSLSVWTPMTKNLFRNMWVNFVGKRKITYIISAVLIIISVASIATNGFKFGIDFTGGRSFVVRFDKAVNAENVRENLSNVFKNEEGESSSIDIKTFGNDSQLKITTDYKINDESLAADQEIEEKLYLGLKNELPNNISLDEFKSTEQNPIGIVSSTKVGPTVADDIKTGGTFAVVASLAGIFAYILIRFRKWQFSLGATLGLIFDAMIILGAFALFHSVMPFNMEINQDFIAAILTVLGYSINDTVIIFDRIREYLSKNNDYDIENKKTLAQVFNDSISSTMGRTVNTSFTILLVVLAIFFFGGDNLKGFMFALLLGVLSGTFSTIFIASIVAYDFMKGKKQVNE
ncbi:MAG: protein translocase subunit SecD [Flavobacteriaceae bacterium]|nr:protein translocase subunit SecD [Flavobacteriaceae bacterium]